MSFSGLNSKLFFFWFFYRWSINFYVPWKSQDRYTHMHAHCDLTIPSKTIQWRYIYIYIYIWPKLLWLIWSKPLPYLNIFQVESSVPGIYDKSFFKILHKVLNYSWLQRWMESNVIKKLEGSYYNLNAMPKWSHPIEDFCIPKNNFHSIKRLPNQFIIRCSFYNISTLLKMMMI